MRVSASSSGWAPAGAVRLASLKMRAAEPSVVLPYHWALASLSIVIAPPSSETPANRPRLRE
jgi:hypothetical protein